MPWVLNIPRFWICQSHTGFSICLNMSEYARQCLNMSKSVLMAFVLHFPIVYLNAWSFILTFTEKTKEYTKFCGSRTIVSLLGLVSSCHRAFVSLTFFLVIISWVQYFFFSVFCRCKIFSFGNFVGPKFFHVDILWLTREYISEEYE